MGKRKKLGLTQANLAKALNYSLQTAAKYENGYAEMDAVSLVACAKLLQVDVDSFMRGIDEKNNDLADRYEFDGKLFSKNLASVRIAKRISQKRLSEEVGCSTRSIKNYEAGNSVPSLTNLLHICDALSITAAELLFEDLSKRDEFRVSAENKRVWVAAATREKKTENN